MDFSWGRRRGASETDASDGPPRSAESDLHLLVVDELAAGEVISAAFVCPPTDIQGEQLLVVTNANVRYVDDQKEQVTFPLEALVGFRIHAGFVRLGFRQTDGGVALVTAFIGGGLRERRELHASIAKAWIHRTRRPFPAADLENSPEIPEID